MKATEFEQLVHNIMEEADLYIEDVDILDMLNEWLWDNLEHLLVTEEDRNYN
jgi:hypothetical protein